MNPINHHGVTDASLGKSAEDRAHGEQARLSAIFHNSANAIAFTDPASGEIVDVNDTWLCASGYRREQVIGKTGSDLGLWGRPADRETCVAAVAKDGRILDFETILVMRGEQRPYLICARGLEIEGHAYVLWELRDISDLKRFQAEQERLRSQLFQARKLQSIGQLAGGVAHDFNNILAGMMMQISLLQAKSHSDPETAEMLREMESEALRASSLTKQLLMFSRRSVLELKPLDLNDVVSNHLKMLGRLIGEHIVVCFNRDAKLPAIEADSAMIEQVLMNLSVNARDAMPNGGRLIISTETVMIDEGQSRAHPDRRPGLFVGLSVIDDGVGMDHETLAQMFEPFFTTKSPGHGTGLGLATVHGIVAQHQGWVEAQSELGKGTTVRVLFPESPRRPAREVKSAALSAAGGNETILLVEDEPTVRRMAGRCLRNLGYRVVDACDGAEATRIWRLLRDEIDMLFTDMVMPEGLSGLDLIRLFRDERPELKTLISSGYSIEMIESGPSSDKTIAYLPKPYDATTLAGAIRKCLDTRSK